MIFYPRCVFLFFFLADFLRNVGLFILFLASRLNHSFFFLMGFPGGSDSKESSCHAGYTGLIPWRRER